MTGRRRRRRRGPLRANWRRRQEASIMSAHSRRWRRSVVRMLKCDIAARRREMGVVRAGPDARGGKYCATW